MDLVARRYAGLAARRDLNLRRSHPSHAFEVWGLLFVDVPDRRLRSGSNRIAPMRTPAYDDE
jgi:hypothetical protein